MDRLSEPFAKLYEVALESGALSGQGSPPSALVFDLLIIGSGYGGSVIAARVAEHFATRDAERERQGLGPLGRPRIAVLERGQEFLPGEFPNDLGTIFEEVRIDNWDSDSPTGNADALFNFIRGRDVTAVVGQALGGGSQINASVTIRAPQATLAGWADDLGASRPDGSPSPYTRAEQMLLPTHAPDKTGQPAASQPRYAKDEAFERVFGRQPASNDATNRPGPAPIAVHFVDTKQSAPGIDIPARACNGCGNCVTGCNYGAKNTLTQTYLPLAYREGVELYTQASVERVSHDPVADAQHPWQVHVFPAQFEKAGLDAYRVCLRSRLVVLAAGAIGSTELLMRSEQAQADALRFSRQLGHRVSGNGDSLSFSFWEKAPVHAAGWDSPDCPDHGSEGAAADSRAADSRAADSRAADSRATDSRTAGGPAASGEATRPAQPQAQAQAQAQATPQPARATPVPPGPTITAKFEARTTSHGQPAQNILVENGVIPGAIASLVAEFTNTSAFTHDLTIEQWQAQRQGFAGGDGAVTYDEARTHTQTFLTMCDDGAPYVLAPGQSREDKDPAAPPPDPSRARNFRRAFIHRPDRAPMFQMDSDAWLERVLTTDPTAASAGSAAASAADGPANDGRGDGRNDERMDGRHDGIMVSNPAYSPISSRLRKLLSGAKPGGGVVTVHPLGGCAIGRTVEDGVVDARFRVFRRSDAEQRHAVDATAVHDGLYVCDGAVFPRAIGVNPFLTIAALGERCSQSIVEALGAFEQAGIRYDGPRTRALPTIEYQPIFHRQRGATRMRFNERLSTPLTQDNATGVRRGAAFDESQIRQLEPLFFRADAYAQHGGFAGFIHKYLQVHYRLPEQAMPIADQAGLPVAPEQHDFSGLSIPPMLALEVNWAITDIAGFLRGERRVRVGDSQGPHQPELTASLSMEFDESTLLPRSDRVHRGAVLEATEGEVQMFVQLPADDGQRFRRKWRAVWQWLTLRGFKEISYEFTKPFLDRSQQSETPWWRAIARIYKERKDVTLGYAARAGAQRGFAYVFKFRGQDGEAYELRGEKLLTFRRDLNPWNAVSQIPQATITRLGDQSVIWSGRLRFDVREFAKRLTPEVLEAPHLLAGIESVLQYGLFTARVMFQHGLWHFRMPDYKPSIPRQWEWPGEWRRLHRETFDVPVPAQLDGDRASGQFRYGEAEDSFIRLTRYQNEALMSGAQSGGRSRGAVLMYHGLLHSAVCFTTRYLRDRHDESIPLADLSLDSREPQNMVEFFCARGYECWTVDMRVSTANAERKRKWTLDEVACWDVPTSIHFVNEHIRGRGLPPDEEPPVFAFAHCMGAAVFSMASLSGLVQPRSKAPANATQAETQATAQAAADTAAPAGHEPPANRSKIGYIDGLVLCQFGPFMVPSDSNMGRTAAVQLGRDFMAIDNYNPVEDAASTREERPLRDREAMFDTAAAAVMFDRLASSYPLSDEERAGHQLSWFTPVADQQICNRLSLMIGENFVHENLARGSHRNLEEFIGPTRLETFWQTLYFGVKGRVVDYEGRNVYAVDLGVEQRPREPALDRAPESAKRGFVGGFEFPILFLHGEKNGLFHPRSTFLAMQHLRRLKGGPNVAQRYQYYKVDGFGHLENVLGKDASRKVFPAVERFFDSIRPGRDA